MTDPTPLDRAHDALARDMNDDGARLKFYGALADSELFILLEREPEGRASLVPEILDLEGDRFALVFDREERLSAFAERIAPYAALPGRVIAGMLAGRNIGLGLNLGVAPSSILIPAEAMDWLSDALGQAPEAANARPTGFHPPSGAEALAAALGERLAGLSGSGARAYLAEAEFTDHADMLSLVLIGAPQAEEARLSQTAREALLFSGSDTPQLATLFLPAGSALAAQVAKTGLEIDLPAPAPRATPAPPAPPGSDPDHPPKLR